MKRLLYAIRLFAWFSVREYARKEPFKAYLEQYDKRQANFRGEE